MNRNRILHSYIVCLLLMVPLVPHGMVLGQSGQATQLPAPPVQSLETFIEEMRRNNPELQAARSRWEASMPRRARERVLPDPRITVGWMSGTWPLPGFGLGSEPMANIGIQYAQELPFPGKLQLRSNIAGKEAAVEEEIARGLELNLISRMKGLYYEIGFLEEARDLLQKNQALLQQLAQVVEARYAVGKATQPDLIRTGVENSILEGRRIELEQKEAGLKAQFNGLLNRDPRSELEIPGAREFPPPLPPLDRLQEKARQFSPQLAAQQALIDRRELEVRLAQKEFSPDFDLMGGYYNQGSWRPMWEFKLEVKLPLFARHKQRLALEEAKWRWDESQKGSAAGIRSLEVRLQEQYLAAQTARKLMDLYSRMVVPQSQLALESALAGYESGTADFPSVLSQFNTIREYQLNYFEQQSNYYKALAALEELTGDNIVHSEQLSQERKGS